MILRFRHKGLERLFAKGDSSGMNPQLVNKLRHMLTLLHNGKSPHSLKLPGYRLHPLKGRRKGQWSATVSAIGGWCSSLKVRTQRMLILWTITEEQRSACDDDV
jgi:toxin HigB-1